MLRIFTTSALAFLLVPAPSPTFTQRAQTATRVQSLELVACSPNSQTVPNGELCRLALRTGKVRERGEILGDRESLYCFDLALSADTATVWIAQLQTSTRQIPYRSCLQEVDLATRRERSRTWLKGEVWLSTIALDERGETWGGLVYPMPPKLVKIDARTGSFATVGELDAMDFAGLEFHGKELWGVLTTVAEPRFDELVQLDPANARVLSRVRIQLTRRVTSLEITRGGVFLVSACDMEANARLESERSGIYELDPVTGVATKRMGLLQTDPLVRGMQVLER